MKRRVLIIKRRLDFTIIRFGLKVPNKNIEPIRIHWQNFVDRLHEYHAMRHDKVVVVEEERWKFINMIVQFYNPDIAYIPHTDKKNFIGSDVCRYYMQTVFPWLFTVDKEGWGGNASHSKDGWEVAPDEDRTFNLFKERADRGESKFDQPNKEFVNNIGAHKSIIAVVAGIKKATIGTATAGIPKPIVPLIIPPANTAKIIIPTMVGSLYIVYLKKICH